MAGNVIPLDLFKVTYGNDLRYGFMSITWSVIADIDRESEKYRWMGATRFTYTGSNFLPLVICSGLTKALSAQNKRGKIKYLPDRQGIAALEGGDKWVEVDDEVLR